MLVHLPDMSMIGPMSTPDYQASPDVWDWDAMPDPTIDELAAASTAGLDLIWGWDAMPDIDNWDDAMPVFGELY